jgi:pimeloyl-ACP methyl ester carboxylesterase
MGNNRGNKYSIAHTHLDPKGKEFWEFSWDQMALYDFPDMVNYVINQTGFENIGYVGHSEGTMQVFAGLSYNPSLSSKINSFVALGPVAEVGHITNEIMRALAALDVALIFEIFGVKEFLPSSALLNELFSGVCRDTPFLCDDIIELLCGKHNGAFNNSRMQVVGANEPGGTSVQNVAHFSQGVRKKDFAMFDYGTREENMKHYNQPTPPSYNLTNFPSKSVPVSLFYGTADELADPTDVAWLIGNLPMPPVYAIELKDYAHLDYVWDYTAAQVFYPTIVSLLNNGSSL